MPWKFRICCEHPWPARSPPAPTHLHHLYLHFGTTVETREYESFLIRRGHGNAQDRPQPGKSAKVSSGTPRKVRLVPRFRSPPSVSVELEMNLYAAWVLERGKLDSKLLRPHGKTPFPPDMLWLFQVGVYLKTLPGFITAACYSKGIVLLTMYISCIRAKFSWHDFQISRRLW